MGWAVAALVGIVIFPLFRLSYGLFAEPPIERGEPTAAVVVTSLVSGFLAYLIGGYTAARLAGHSGGRHGALTAVLGLIVGIVLAVAFSFLGCCSPGAWRCPPWASGSPARRSWPACSCSSPTCSAATSAASSASPPYRGQSGFDRR